MIGASATAMTAMTAMTTGHRDVRGIDRRHRALFNLALIAIVAVASAALQACGGDDDSGGAGMSGTGAGGGEAGPPATGCANFDNWHCIIAGHQCIASCEQQQIACDGFNCARATSAMSSEFCADVTPQRRDDCGDCRAAFEAGCR
jgi:hypothetical protein